MNTFRVLLLPFVLAACAASGDSSRSAPEDPAAARAATARAQASAVLDTLHDSAAHANSERYYALFTPDAVFLGTDARERWSFDQLRAYADPIFLQGRGWTYVPTERYLGVSPNADVVWFDERLHNEKYGEVRGSGVLVATPSGFKIAQYNLSIPVPNALASDLVTRIRAQAP